MATEIEEVKEAIRKVEHKIDNAEEELRKAATTADVDYWREKEKQLRKDKEQLRKQGEQLREKELLLLKAESSSEITCPNI